MQIYNLAGSDVGVTIRDSDLFAEPIHYLQVEETRRPAGFELPPPSFVSSQVPGGHISVLRSFSWVTQVCPLTGPPQVRDGSSAGLQQDPEHRNQVSG